MRFICKPYKPLAYPITYDGELFTVWREQDFPNTRAVVAFCSSFNSSGQFVWSWKCSCLTFIWPPEPVYIVAKPYVLKSCC